MLKVFSRYKFQIAVAILLCLLLFVPADSKTRTPTDNEWVTDGSNIYNANTGNVGIGTNNPTLNLLVSGTGQGNIGVNSTGTSDSAMRFLNQGNEKAIIRSKANGNLGIETLGVEWLTVLGTGKVGLGTTTPYFALQVNGEAVGNGGAWRNFALIDARTAAQGVGGGIAFGGKYAATGSLANDFAGIQGVKENGNDADYAGALLFTTRTNGGNPTERMRVSSAGNVGIGTTNPTAALSVAGDVVVSGNIAAKYQDLAEWVASGETLDPGTVVIADPDKDNQVVTARIGYDTSVAGVIASSPGILLGEGGPGRVRVSTTGRVKVKVDATLNAIAVGDLLVTSDTPGYAMKSEVIQVAGFKIHRPGTILGKALQPMRSGKGEILVLLCLQ